jgi:hypothetical protein
MNSNVEPDDEMKGNVEPDESNPDSAVQPVPIFEVAFRNGMWWSMPEELSKQLYEKYMGDEDASYIWDWGETRPGSWKPDNEETSINLYVVDFVAMEQRNTDNDRRRSVRLVWVHPAKVTPLWSGEKP